jgi:hypothetical protein
MKDDDGVAGFLESVGEEVNKLSRPIDDRRRLVMRAADIRRCFGEKESIGALPRNDSDRGMHATNKLRTTKPFTNAAPG